MIANECLLIKLQVHRFVIVEAPETFSGKVAATLIGGAVGAQVGANAPRQCTYRNNSTGQTYKAACP